MVLDFKSSHNELVDAGEAGKKTKKAVPGVLYGIISSFIKMRIRRLRLVADG